MKKEIVAVFFIVCVLFSVYLVFAQAPEQIVEDFIENTKEVIKSIFRPIIGGETGDDFLLPKVGFFFITYLLVVTALRSTDIFGSNKTALFVTSVVVAILSARFIPDVDIIRSMILPYISLFTAVGYIGA
ncbi:MAG: hypothetical protein RL557_782, partial [archaeon]